MNKLNKVGESRQPCLTPFLIEKDGMRSALIPTEH